MAPPGLSDAPAPWRLTAEAWSFVTWSWTPILPAGAFDPAEKAALGDAPGSRLYRTPYGINIFRYNDSPVGPYDEIMFIPGWYQTNIVDDETGKSRLSYDPRVTRIYVSTDASIYNGRKNWNIPKHKADFQFTYSPSGSVSVSVSLPSQAGDAPSPFFRASLAPSAWLPSFPFKTTWLPFSLALVQPPLPHLSDVETGTTQWQKIPFTIAATKKAQVAYLAPPSPSTKTSDAGFGTDEVTGRKRVFANGRDFPDVPGLGIGLYLPEAVVDFMEPTAVQIAPLPDHTVNAGRTKTD